MHTQLPKLSELSKSVVINGHYEHYKGMRYTVLAVARDSETLEEMVVYKAIYGDREVWVRPLTMFLENVIIDGKLQPRFKQIYI
jgi:hypothetical protein